MWQYASINEIISVLKAIVVGAVLSYAAAYLILPERVPFSIEVRSMETVLLLVGASVSSGESSAVTGAIIKILSFIRLLSGPEIAES